MASSTENDAVVDGDVFEEDVVVDVDNNREVVSNEQQTEVPMEDRGDQEEEHVSQYADGVDDVDVGDQAAEATERSGDASVEVPVTSTPRCGQDKSKKTLKEKLGAIPARLSKLSLLNAIRSGTYVVNEPPPTTTTTTTTTADNEIDENIENKDNDQPPDANAVNARMTDNGIVANEDNVQVALTKMTEDALQEPEVNSTLPLGPSRKIHSMHRSALTKLLCGLYALLLVVFGGVFAVANALTVQERQHLYYLEAIVCLIPARFAMFVHFHGRSVVGNVWQVFLLYLYFGSLATLLYFQFCILRGRQVRNAVDNSIRVVIRRSEDNLQLSPCPSRKDNAVPTTPTTLGSPLRDVEEGDVGLEPRKEPLDQMSTLSNTSSPSHLVLPPDGHVAHVGEGINFYLRLGALAFSIGSVTLDGFHIASYFETENTTTCESHIFTLVYVVHLIFTFVQTFFLFKNHKLVIDKNKASVRFGLMHLLATNLCVWFVTAVTETAEDYRQQDYFASRNVSNPPVLKSCYEDMTLARTASPYLFPCTIIYSIIAAGIVYRMYTYVGVKVKQRWPSHTSLTSSVPHGVVSMDCEKANKGLFTGLLVAVITLIAIATFFVFDSRLNYPYTAIKVFFVMEISLLVLTGGCIIVGRVRFQQLLFLENYLSLDSVLLLVSLAGAYVYLSFMLISSASTLASHGITSILSLVTIAVGLVQSTLQAIFVLDGLCRRAENDAQVESKPGRAVVTFLLVCNLALWVVTLFEIRKTMVVPFHQSFYGILPWNIILHLCVPLYIYFRFHSAICLSKIWYNAYTKEKIV